jgi:hypothetical protein
MPGGISHWRTGQAVLAQLIATTLARIVATASYDVSGFELLALPWAI